MRVVDDFTNCGWRCPGPSMADYDHPELLSSCCERLVTGSRLTAPRTTRIRTMSSCQLHQWQLWVELSSSAPCLATAGIVQTPPDASFAPGQPAIFFCRCMLVSALSLAARASLCSSGLLARLGSYKRTAGRGGRRAIPLSSYTQWWHAAGSATMPKRRQLRACGWQVVAVPYFEWEQLGDGAGDIRAMALGGISERLQGCPEDKVCAEEEEEGAASITALESSKPPASCRPKWAQHEDSRTSSRRQIEILLSGRRSPPTGDGHRGEAGRGRTGAQEMAELQSLAQRAHTEEGVEETGAAAAASCFICRCRCLRKCCRSSDGLDRVWAVAVVAVVGWTGIYPGWP